MTQARPNVQARGPGDASPAARNLTEWFRQLDQCVRMARTFGPWAPNCRAARERAVEDLMGLLEFHAPFVLHCTPLEIWLRDEAVVRPPAGNPAPGALERRLPFLLYRDGVRALTFTRETTREDVAALLEGLARATTAQVTDADLVTLLWEADLTGLRVDVAPLDPAEPPDGPLPAPPCDWPVPDGAADPGEAWRALAADEVRERTEFAEAWARERSTPWPERAGALVREALARDPGPETADALGQAIATWIASAIERCEWDEAIRAVGALRDADPDGARTAPALERVLASVDAEAVAERLDESEEESQARFFALAVRLGRPALDLLVGVLAIATRVRLRAAATTALGYLCADEPALLARHLADPRWYVVRNVVFVLGQIGGPEVVALLAGTVRHPDVRVRRSVAHALGQAPPPLRLPLLIDLLDSADAPTVAATLAMLARESDPRVAAALLERTEDSRFEERPDDVKVALVAALGELAGAEAVPALGALRWRGGWFARRTAERGAAAHALARLGSPTALAVLRDGLGAHAEAVRACCADALARRERAA